jgi:hypothetical protein
MAIKHEHIAFLPKSITELSGLHSSIITAEPAQDLPRGLRSLGGLGTRFDVPAIPYLPPAMKQLDMDLTHHRAHGYSAFPPSLTFLDGFDSEMAPFLPPSLTHLNSYAQFTPENTKALPNQLTQLGLWNTCRNSSDGLGETSSLLFLPPSLTHLTIGGYKPLSLPADSSAWIPRTLTHLSLLRKCKAPPGFFSGLPASLTYLQSRTASFSISDAQDLTKAVPSLNTLFITIFGSKKQESKNLLESLCHLPSGLQRLDLGFHYGNLLRSEHLATLPPRITAVEITARRLNRVSIHTNFKLPKFLLTLSLFGVPIDIQPNLAE